MKTLQLVQVRLIDPSNIPQVIIGHKERQPDKEEMILQVTHRVIAPYVHAVLDRRSK